MSENNFKRIQGLQRFVTTEVALFFGYVLAMMFYIIWVKIYVNLKEGLSSTEELNELDE